VPVLSNDNLGTVKQQFTITPAVWQGLIARHFVYVPPIEGPTVAIIPDSEPAQYAVPPTYPLTNNSYPNTPFYPPIYPAFYPSPGFSEGFGSLTPSVVVREIIREQEAPRLQPGPPAPLPVPAPAPAPAKNAPRGSLPLGRLGIR
jgi:hypothetical protein